MKQKNLRQKTEAVPQREVSILQKRVNALKLSESPIDVSCFTKEGMIHDFEVFVEQEASDDSEGPEQYLEVDKGPVHQEVLTQFSGVRLPPLQQDPVVLLVGLELLQDQPPNSVDLV